VLSPLEFSPIAVGVGAGFKVGRESFAGRGACDPKIGTASVVEDVVEELSVFVASGLDSQRLFVASKENSSGIFIFILDKENFHS
jgi:hypothetical protein